MKLKEELLAMCGGNIKDYLQKLDFKIYEKAEEIRIRVHKPITIKIQNQLKSDFHIPPYIPTHQDIAVMMEALSGYSLYAFNEEIRKGFLTLKGGHRMGIGGKTILREGDVIDIRQITSLNIRIAKEVTGNGEMLLPFLLKDRGIRNTMIISPPGCGKTTLLRDLIPLISNRGISITVIDERSEICHEVMDWGINTDVLDGCPKTLGMRMALRSMAPQVIAVDEVASKEDAREIWEMSCSGIQVLCTAHGESLEALKKRGELKELLEKQLIERFIFLANKGRCIGQVQSILDEGFSELWKGVRKP